MCSWVKAEAGPGALLRPCGRGGLTLTCSLSPAAGTTASVPSSCLSLSQHPSPSSVFRHHYIRTSEVRRAGCGLCPRATRRSSCLAALCLLPHIPAPWPSHAVLPLCVLCVQLCRCVRVPRRQLLVSGLSSKVGKRVLGQPTTPTLGWLQSLYLSHPMLSPSRLAGMGGLLA